MELDKIETTTIPVTKSMMDEAQWIRWLMQTARSWDDISELVKMTGIERVDNDHVIMAGCAIEINNLISDFERDGFNLTYIEKQTELFDRLYQYTVSHFQYEEKVMQDYNHPRYLQHKKQHDDILLMLFSTINDFKAGRLTVSLNLKLAILDWVVVHINKFDFNDFTLKNWTEIIGKAKSWEEISFFIKSMGNYDMDDDHKGASVSWLDFCNYMDEVNLAKPDHNEILQLNQRFNKFYRLSDIHFGKEEQLIKDYNLSNLTIQINQHKKFLQKLQSYQTEFRAGNFTSFRDIKMFVLEWWINHINGVDFLSFGFNRWELSVMEKAQSWEDVSMLIKLMGIEKIDKEHNDMTVCALKINNVIQNYEYDQSKNKLKESVELFQTLYQIADKHFENEEKLMKNHNNKHIQKHHEQHQKFLKLMIHYKEHIASGRQAVSLNLKRFILEWWINHINKIDYQTFVEK
ncbi:MAG: hypothetical protein HQK79_19705 [Desulfobacterales bacterium]|nr:hypothetical protein [Desulfobacterales bacterium]